MEVSAVSAEIVAFDNMKHRDQVVGLWRRIFEYDAPHNAPKLVINKKLAVEDGLFFVAVRRDVVVGAVMAGYDGHRGWIYSLAVHPNHRKQGIGSALLKFAERRLSSRRCMKINLQIMEGNEDVQQFYKTNGYVVEKRVSMGKRLIENIGIAEPAHAAD